VAVCTLSSSANIKSTQAFNEARVWDAPAALRLWHLASLDAPTVALVWSWAFAWAGQVRVRLWGPLVLAMIAWAVYIGDRLLDARAGLQSPPRHLLRERHYFHWRHRWILASAGLAAAAGAAGMVMTRLPAGARAPDSVLAAATLAYFSGVHSRGRLWHLAERLLAPFSSRALVIGVLFTAGCLLPAASQAPPGASAWLPKLLSWPTLFFVLLGWLNCHAIGQWESASSPRCSRLVRRAGLLAAAGALLAIYLWATEPRVSSLVAAGVVSALLLAVLEWIRGRLTPVALRAGADLVLLTPVFLLVLAR
jgi:hypothetical protein